ncbi:class F sortase [Streptomyces chromofuscus]|uniref:Class F sortase n=1 Tax=Streptomyces chromofuscus TaxID=42881 RepID=A0A7M2T808_STRCW|nr:class F sortase [Streptomyces chromofuscus]QOV44860.1 class F sortase [Streptomyces chromofuscus]GGT33741.1 class F sortase [Streptomyces chromofuscus]
MAADPSSTPSAQPAANGQYSGQGGRLTLWGVAIVIIAASVFGDHQGPGTVPATSASAPATASISPDADTRRAARPLPRATPIRLLIPKISVDAPFTPLAIGASGQLEPPSATDTNLVGWYAKGASPGERGTSIIAGHVDTATAPAVFAGLYELRRGDRFSVDRSDGRKADFVVDHAETFPKDDFPDERVYADTARSEVRLITCAGDYDHSVKDYTENLVVFGHLV